MQLIKVTQLHPRKVSFHASFTTAAKARGLKDFTEEVVTIPSDAAEMAQLLNNLINPKQVDCEVIPREAADKQVFNLTTKPWLLMFEDGNIDEFDSEDQACEAQRKHRILNRIDPETGERL